MKLFVWEKVLRDHTDGMVVVLARNEAEAWEVLRATDEAACMVLDGSLTATKKVAPKVYPVTEKRGFVVWGGA